jgi:hypothetical protein
MRTATFNGPVELDENILHGENGQSIFDPVKQQLDPIASEGLISSKVVSQGKINNIKGKSKGKDKISASDDDEAMENKREVD